MFPTRRFPTLSTNIFDVIAFFSYKYFKHNQIFALSYTCHSIAASASTKCETEKGILTLAPDIVDQFDRRVVDLV